MIFLSEEEKQAKERGISIYKENVKYYKHNPYLPAVRDTEFLCGRAYKDNSSLADACKSGARKLYQKKHPPIVLQKDE